MNNKLILYVLNKDISDVAVEKYTNQKKNTNSCPNNYPEAN